LFFNILVISLKKSSYKIKKGSLGLTKKDKVKKKGEVVNKNTNKKVYKV
jgi:hypothetical protein